MKVKYILLSLAAVCVAVAWQGSSPVWMYGWNGGPLWMRLGPTLAVTNGQMDIVLPPVVSAPVRRRDVLLAYDAVAKGWKIPAGATNLEIHVNGIRYRSANYTISNAGVLAATFGNMLPEHEVTIDYDEATK